MGSARANCASCHAPTVLVMIGLAIWCIQFSFEAGRIVPGTAMWVFQPITSSDLTAQCDNDLTMCLYPYNADGTSRNITQSEGYKCWKASYACQAGSIRGALASYAIGRILSFIYLIGLIIYAAVLMKKKLA